MWISYAQKQFANKQYIEDIQMFLLNMSFISRVKWAIFIFHEWNKKTYLTKNIWIFFL